MKPIKNKLIQVRVTQEQYDKLLQVCENEQTNPSSIIRKFIVKKIK